MEIRTNIQKIYNSALRFLTPLSLQDTYRIIIEEAKKLVDAKYASIFVMENDNFIRIATTDPILKKIIPRKRGITYKVYKKGKPYLSSNTRLSYIHPEFKKLGIGSEVSISLSYNDITLGVLSVISDKEKYFNESEIDTLKLFQPLATLALRKSLLFAQVEEALRVRDLFISTAAHEIRTPLTSVYIYSQLLEKQISEGKTLNNDYISKILAGEVRLTKLIDELLEVSRINTGKLNYSMSSFDFTKVISRAISDISHIYPSYKIYYKSNIRDKEAGIKGDFDKLIQVVSNLLHNAVKYSPAEKPIILTLNEKGKWYELEVKDKGVGISKEDLPVLFNKYYKGKGAKTEGMGIGLYLVKHIIDNHKGTIEIKSKLNKGTKVIIKLPKLGKYGGKRT